MRSSTPSLGLPLVLAVATLAGCRGQQASFPGHSDPEVWNAMVTVAENPEYHDWHVFENEVAATRPEGRIEIYRVLQRDLVEPGRPPRRQEQDWNITVQFLYTDPPTIEFKARDTGIPAHAWTEADRYFDDMRRVLAGAAVQEVEEVPEVEQVDAAPVSIDELGDGPDDPAMDPTDTLEQLLDVDRP